jgi:hypothetical protein
VTPPRRSSRFTLRWLLAGGVVIALAIASVPYLLVPERHFGPEEAKSPGGGKVECQPPPEPMLSADAPRYFTDVTDELGIDFEHIVGPLGTYFMPESVGAGGALFDYDSDGDQDLYLVNCGKSPKAIGDFAPGARTENRLFRQEADGTFRDVTAESGLGDTGYGMGCAVADIDNDGDPDIYITNYGPDRLYLNNGDGTFRDITAAAGIDNPDWGTCAVWFDYDRDGWVDLFVVNYADDPEYGHSIACGFYQGRVSYCGPLKFRPTVDRLFHNEGPANDDEGRAIVRFREVTHEAGIDTHPTWGFGVVSADFNRDGWPDVYVASDAGMNPLWINQQDGTFKNEGGQRGVAFNQRGTPEGSMGIAIGDADGDGQFDIVVSNLETEGASLFRNLGEGLFEERAQMVGLAAATRPHTGWGTALIDLDHDGNLDLPLVNGRVVPCRHGFAPHGEETLIVRSDQIDDPAAYWREYTDLNQLFFGTGDGKFTNRTDSGGDFAGAIASGRGLIYGDIDNDGDLDLVVTNCGTRARVYRNDVPKRGHWLRVQLVDPTGQRDAYGAEVTVVTGERRMLRLCSPAGSYLASHDPRLHFGLGDADHYDAIHVRWPDGAEEQFAAGEADQQIALKRGAGTTVGPR